MKRFFFGSLLAGGVLTLIFRVIPKSKSLKPGNNRYLFDKIDVYIQGQMKRLNIPGASLGIVEGDKIVHLRGFGQARPGGEVPSPRTPFFIGSLTKSITALAVMQLVEAGKVELDAPVQRYLHWFRVADPLVSARMTVRHLLNQTSGIPTVAGSIILADFDNRPGATERQVRALSKLKITRPLGSKCEYSNLNYNILGLIVEAASGELYADYIQTHIFNPLGMNHSFSSKALAQQNGLAVGHRHWFGYPFPTYDLPIPRGSLPSGQFISCSEDMANYLIAHLNGGCYDKKQILSGVGIDELHRGEVEYIAMGISAGKYAMGWFDLDMGGTRTFYHGGNVPDFSGYMALLPGHKKGVVLLLNADPYGLPPILEEVGLGVTALLAGHQPAPIRLDFIQWIMRLLPLIPLLQIAGVLTTLRSVRRWRKDEAFRPSSGRMWGQHIILPLIPDLSLVTFLATLQSNGLIRFLQLYMPDFAWIARISGGFAGIWAFLRTGLILHTLRKSPASKKPNGGHQPLNTIKIPHHVNIRSTHHG